MVWISILNFVFNEFYTITHLLDQVVLTAISTYLAINDDVMMDILPDT